MKIIKGEKHQFSMIQIKGKFEDLIKKNLQQIECLKQKFKPDHGQVEIIESLISNEAKILREKLYEAHAVPFNGKGRSFRVEFTVVVEEIPFFKEYI